MNTGLPSLRDVASRAGVVLARLIHPRISCKMAFDLWISDVLVILRMFRVGWGWLVGVDLVDFGDCIGKSSLVKLLILFGFVVCFEKSDVFVKKALAGPGP